jgi:hypothetical protein
MRERLRSILRAFTNIPVGVIGRWVGIFFFAVVIVLIFIWFSKATFSAWRVQTSSRVSCAFNMNPTPAQHSYIQYNVKDQATEPYFHGSFFINFGNIQTGEKRLEVVTTGGGNYADTSTIADFFRNEQAKSFWMTRESDEVPFYRNSGSHRDFPFDSGAIDFGATFKPAVQFDFLMIRNLNSSFYIPCDTASVTRDGPGKIRVHFEMRRNPLVRMMAIVIMGAASLFVLLIPFTVRLEALPTSVASFFFSIWSIRGVLSSEMKVFPTVLDIAILFLCVLLLLLSASEFFTAGAGGQ